MPETIFKIASNSRLYQSMLGYFERKRKLEVLHFQEPSLIIVRIGSPLNYVQAGYPITPVGTAKISLEPKNGDTQVKIKFDFTKFLLWPNLISLILVILSLIVSIFSGTTLVKSLFAFFIMGGLLLLTTALPFVPLKLIYVKETKAKFIRDFRRFLRKTLKQ